MEPSRQYQPRSQSAFGKARPVPEQYMPAVHGRQVDTLLAPNQLLYVPSAQGMA